MAEVANVVAEVADVVTEVADGVAGVADVVADHMADALIRMKIAMLWT